jgi:hypothetical protein
MNRSRIRVNLRSGLSVESLGAKKFALHEGPTCRRCRSIPSRWRSPLSSPVRSFLRLHVPPHRQATLRLTRADAFVPVAFVNVTVVPMERDETLAGQTVVIRNGRIAQIGPADRIDVPRDARRIPGAGKYLMPGLVDAHFHLQSNDDDRRLLQMLVANGVTSILNLYGTPAILELRGRVGRGDVTGPTIYTSGPYISDAPNWQPEADEVERLVVAQKRAGYDLIKTHGDFSREAFHRLCAVAHRERMKVIGHAPRNLGVEPMFEEHMDALAHSEEFLYAYFFYGASDLSRADPETRRRFLENAEKRIPELAAATAKAEMWVVPNVVAYKMIVEQGKDLASVLSRPETTYLPPRLAAEWQPGHNRYVRKYPPEMAGHIWGCSRSLRERLTTQACGCWPVPTRPSRASCPASPCTTS